MSKIQIIQPEEATGRLKEIYDDLVSSRGKIAEVHKIQSLRPESIVKHMDLYMEIMFTKSELSRAEREMIAVVVSASNKCNYCQIHHAEALKHYWKNDEKVNQLREDYRLVDLTEKELALCTYADHLTINPGGEMEGVSIEALKEIGVSDNGVLDATLVISYFNFVNRIVLSLGVNIETESGASGYKY